MSERTVDDVIREYRKYFAGPHRAANEPDLKLLVAEIDALRAAVRDAYAEADPFEVFWIERHEAIIARAKEAENVGTF